jgi:hypothetical protein
LNDWTSIIIVVAGALGYLISARFRPGREVVLVRHGTAPVEATPVADDAPALVSDDVPVPEAEEVTVGSDSERDPPPTPQDGGIP